MSSWQALFISPVLKNRWRIARILFFSFLAALFEGVSFGFILFALSSLNPESGFVPFKGLSPQMGFATNIALAVLTQVLRSVSSFIAQSSCISLSTQWQTLLQKNIYAQILRMSFSCASRYKAGDLIDYTRAPMNSAHPVVDNINKALVAVLSIAALVVTMMWLSLNLTVVAVVLFGGVGFLQKWIIRRVSEASRKYSEHLAEFSKESVQTLQGLRAIFTFNRQKEMLGKTDTLLGKMAFQTTKITSWNNLIVPINEISGILLVGLFLLLGLSSSASLPILLTFITIVYRLNGRVQTLFSSMAIVANNWGHLLRIQEILEDKGKEFSSEEGIRVFSFEKGIEFEEVSLRYAGREHDALKEISFSIPKGKVTAIVGPSGAGKSSILDLLLRLYAPGMGRICVDGRPIEELNIESWRALFGVVSQDISIFHETIEANLLFGLEGVAREKIYEAAEISGAHDFIKRLPQGYDTVVGERGYRLSGGEKQRLALARALLRDPEILLLDEATSSLDSHSEWLIKKALQEIEKTMVMIAHRLSSITHSDQILVVDQGRIVEQGMHFELLQNDGIYAALWKIQVQEAELLV